jgi:hypothetical protein
MIKVTCPNVSCGKLSAVKEEFAGRQAKCPACGTIMKIPAAPQAATPRQAEPAVVKKHAALANRLRLWTTKVRQAPAMAMASHVLGGLSILAGLLTSLILGEWAATRRVIATKGMSAERAEQIAREFAKAEGAATPWMVTFFAVLGIVMLIWGAAAIAGGVGLSQRRVWSRPLALVVAGFAGVVALFTLVPVIRGYYLFLIGFIFYLGYSAWLFVVLTRPIPRKTS